MKIGLALGSGSARGLAHIGVLKVLEREKIPIDLIVGTSIGSQIGGIYASGIDAVTIEEIALNISWQQTAKIFFPTISKSGLVDGSKIEKFVENFIGMKTFPKLRIPFAVVATDIETGKEIIIKTGSVSKAIRASCSIPGIFAPMKYRNKYLVDGGLVNPIPADVARRIGADIVIGVNVMSDITRGDKNIHIAKIDEALKKERPLTTKKIRINAKAINSRIVDFIEKNIKNNNIKQKLSEVFTEKRKLKEESKPPSIFNILMQSTFIMEREIAKIKLKEADIAITTEFRRFVNAMDYHRAAECILEGERAAEKALPKLRKKISKTK